MMSETYERKDHLIITTRVDDETGKVTKFTKNYKFINEAKRASATIQRANDGLGCGIVKVAT